jgi:hypothetical protein
MKMSPELRKAQINMQPGAISGAGFLGEDRRPLVDIIESDEEAMQAVGITFEETAERMKHFLEEGRKGLGEPTTVDDHWLVRVEESRGHMPSPFEDGISRKINATITRTDRDVSMVFSQLSIDLLEKHHFLQGKGSPFRLEPSVLKAVFF